MALLGRRRAGGKEGGGLTKEDPAYWMSVKEGDFVSLSDVEAFEGALASGGSGPGLEYRVGLVRAVAMIGPGGEESGGGFRFIELLGPGVGEEGGGGPLYLVVVDLPGRYELGLYFIPEGLEGGTRDEWIDRGDSWPFLPPPDPDDFVSSDLEYAPYPDLPEIEEPGDDGRSVSRKIAFGRASPAPLYGEALDTGAPFIVAEYAAEPEAGEEAPRNPLLLLEEGWMRKDGSKPEEGGYLTAMLGRRIALGELEHYPA